MLSFKKKYPLACLGAAKGMKRHTRVDTYASSLKKLTAWSSNKKGVHGLFKFVSKPTSTLLHSRRFSKFEVASIRVPLGMSKVTTSSN